MHSTSAQFKKEQHVECRQPGRFDRKEITGQQLLLVVAQKRVPAAAAVAALRSRRNPVAPENISNGRASNLMPEFEQFALKLAVAPGWILIRKPEEQRFHFRSDERPAHPALATERPFATDEVTVPLEHCLGLEQEDDLS